MKKFKQLYHLIVPAIALGVITMAVPVGAAPNSTFNQTINPGTLSTDILNASQTPVGSPAVTFGAKGFSLTCQSGGNAATGTFGTNDERIYVTNNDAADGGWSLSIAATSGATALWTDGANTYDFNDAGGSGCTDGADADLRGGQLTINANPGIVTPDCSGSCTTTGVTKGTSSAFVEGTTNSIPLLIAGSTSDDIWRGYLTGVSLSQTIPAAAPAGSYSINMTLTVVAS